jgi:KDO2-lipid IV(A) lauroyltransferase
MFLKLQHLAEYAFLLPFLHILSGRPMESAERFIKSIARSWFRLDRGRQKTAIANIIRAGLASTPEESRVIALKSFEHFAVLILESLRSDEFISASNWKDSVRAEIPAATMELLTKKGQGLLLASGHIGNWEIAAQTLSFIKPVVGITRPMKNPYINRLMEERKPRNNFRLTPKHDADAARFLKTLRDGEVLAILIDQYAKSTGMMVNFFGHPASTHRSPALLHLVTGAPLCFGYCARESRMKFLLKATEPIIHNPTGDREKDVMTILARLVGELETVIRAYPEQYLWAHRRWRD